MKRWLALLVVTAAQAWGYSSLVIAGGSGVMKVPSVAPFTSLGDYRVEFRIHNWTLPTSPASYPSFFSWGSVYTGVRYLEIFMKSTGEICANDWVDTPMAQTCANLSGHSDVVVRVQRFGGLPSREDFLGSFLLEAQDVNGTAIASYCLSPANPYACAITPNAKDWSGMAGYIGNPSQATRFSLDWLKWFGTTVPPGSPFSQESTPADLSDWRFEGNLTNEGTGGYKATIGPFNSGPAYSATLVYGPACVAGLQQVFRAGYPAQLDGTGANSLNGDPVLRYFWQQMSGPTNVVWTGQDTAQPTVSQTVFGSYVFQLTVTDSGSKSSTCSVKHGFVATDNDNVVITGKPEVDTLLGAMIRFGANPWPWGDNRHKAESDLNAAHLADYYRDFWVGSQGPGTIAVTAGSASVTGSGTDFTTRFCQGPSNPTVPKSVPGVGNASLLVWYGNDSAEGYGLRSTAITSCQSDTQLTLAHVWYGDAADCSGGNCTYSYDDGSYDYGGIWIWTPVGPGEGSNYYDAVAGLYSLYYRTGLDDYLAAARTLADRFWKYRLDSGLRCRYGSPYPDECGPTTAPRVQSTLGMVLRSLDGRPDMWSGLENIFNYYAKQIPTYIGWGAGDIRERAYMTSILSYCSLFDPNETWRTTCKTQLSDFMNRSWTPLRTPEGTWQQLFSQANSWTGGTTSVSTTHGSNLVQGNGTSWTASQFPTHVVFLPTTNQPAKYADQTEQTYYNAAFVDSTHLRLDRPYEGTTGTHGWMLGYGAGAASSFVGWSTQPFVQGILGVAFTYAAEALADSDPVNAARARDYNVGIANWLRQYSVWPATGGMYYIAGSVDCQAPIPDSATAWCGGSGRAASSRLLAPLPLRSVTLAYRDTRDPNLLAFGDQLYNAMFAKPGTCPADSMVCVPDGRYIADLNDGTGWNMSGVPWTNAWQKYFGMVFGFGASQGWPAYRVGLPPLRVRRPVRLGFQMPAGAAAARVTATAPNGEVTTTVCASSPCEVSIDGLQGDHVFRLEYLSGTGAVLASSQLPLSQGR